uniref:Lipocalin n=1 Tax=Rhipicephalus appendiculatus TaxID=34631 RepID=A0A131YS89_RHIAP
MHHCLTAVLLLVGCAFAQVAESNQLFDALNTNETIWVLRRSFERNTTCVSNKMVFLNKTDYQFNHTFINGTSWQLQNLYARLGVNGSKPYMNVSSQQGTTGIKYTLEFWNDTVKCGVLSFWMQAQNKCEMHAWESHINTTSTECEKKYNETCKGQSYAVYSSSCMKDAEKSN